MVWMLAVVFLHRGLLNDTPRLYVDAKTFASYADCVDGARRWQAASSEYWSGICQEVRTRR